MPLGHLRQRSKNASIFPNTKLLTILLIELLAKRRSSDQTPPSERSETTKRGLNFRRIFQRHLLCGKIEPTTRSKDASGSIEVSPNYSQSLSKLKVSKPRSAGSVAEKSALFFQKRKKDISIENICKTVQALLNLTKSNSCETPAKPNRSKLNRTAQIDEHSSLNDSSRIKLCY